MQRRLGASFLLPLGSLLISLLLVTAILPAMIRIHNQFHPRQGKTIFLTPQELAGIDLDAKESRWARPSNEKISAFLNTPGMLMEIAISLPTSWPESWHPTFRFPFDSLNFWRAVS